MERRRQASKGNTQTMHWILIILFAFLTLSLLIKGCSGSSDQKNTPLSPISPPHAGVEDDGLPENSDQPHVTATASIGVTGNIFVHDQLIGFAERADGTYDFSDSFKYVANCYDAYDFMIAHFESTLGGSDAGAYTGSTTFNAPDTIIDALKGSGVDMVLTGNNHIYDTGHNGFLRTQEVLKQKGMLYTGSRLNTETANYVVQNINGIKIGMICYTHETGDTAEGNKTINNNTVATEDTDLINSFNYRQMDEFYEEVKTAKAAMEADGADFVMFFIHWGNEYDLAPSNTQKKVAQNLCEIGIDVIIGSHPCVVQPVQLLTSTTGSNTYCFYSVGNAFAHMRRTDIDSSPNGYTEDGVIFGIEFQRWSDGSVKISNLNATPLWMSQEILYGGGTPQFAIIPVDVSYNFYPTLSTFVDSVNNVIDPDCPATNIAPFTPSDPTQISASYARTMKTILEGLNECRQSLGLTPISNTSGN